MTTPTLSPSMRGSVTTRRSDWRALLPLVAIFVAQVGLYVWMAPRGFDFTDEAFYFLSYLHWRDIVGTVTFFGAYFELPFRMLGQSVAAIRIFSLLLLLACSAFFTLETFSYCARRDGTSNGTPWRFVSVGMAGSLFYFGYFSTLRAPSYNLLALCSMLVATGLLLRMLERQPPHATMRVAMFCYGLAIGACGLGKAPSGVLLVVVHVLFFARANRDWRRRRLLELVGLSLAGAGLNFALLQWAHPQWLSVLREGVAMNSLDSGHGLLNLANGLRWDIQRLAPMLPWAVGIMVAFVVLVRWIGPLRPSGLSAMVAALISGSFLGLIWDGPARAWLPILGLDMLLLWSVEGLNRKPYRLLPGDAKDVALMLLLLALPVAFSFGTNLPILAHSQMAAVFVVVALCIRLHRLFQLGLLARSALVVCLTVMCVPMLAIQMRAALDVHYTYRQLSALGEQTLPVRIGVAGNTLLVDATTRTTLQSVIDAARSAGFAPGQKMLDFTGDGPGLVYALGGEPLGAAWLLGGYSHSQGVAARVVAQLPDQVLRSAWLLSSEDNPRAIRSWQQMLDGRLGEGAHERAATVSFRAPYRWGVGAPENISLQLWKPRVAVAPRP